MRSFFITCLLLIFLFYNACILRSYAHLNLIESTVSGSIFFISLGTGLLIEHQSKKISIIDDKIINEKIVNFLIIFGCIFFLLPSFACYMYTLSQIAHLRPFDNIMISNMFLSGIAIMSSIYFLKNCLNIKDIYIYNNAYQTQKKCKNSTTNLSHLEHNITITNNHT